MTVKNVLQMASGISFNENYGDLNSDVSRLCRELLTVRSRISCAASPEKRASRKEHPASTRFVGYTGLGLVWKARITPEDEYGSSLAPKPMPSGSSTRPGEAAAAGGQSRVLRCLGSGCSISSEGPQLPGRQLVRCADSVTRRIRLSDARPRGCVRQDPFGWLSVVDAVDWQGDFSAAGIYGAVHAMSIPPEACGDCQDPLRADYGVGERDMKAKKPMHAFQAIANAL